jgi:hypothetical protein
VQQAQSPSPATRLIVGRVLSALRRRRVYGQWLLVIWIALWSTGLAVPATRVMTVLWQPAPNNSEESNSCSEAAKEAALATSRQRRSNVQRCVPSIRRVGIFRSAESAQSLAGFLRHAGDVRPDCGHHRPNGDRLPMHC